MGESDKVGYVALDGKTRAELVALGCRAWDHRVMLLPVALLRRMKPGTKLVSIDGREVVVGVDALDEDTRYGVTAFGVVRP